VIAVSVCIVSRHRPAALVRAMRGVALQDHPALELVVVADPAGAAAARATGLHAKVIDHDADGIGAARNTAIDAAAGAVIAFLDDDAVPEPTWAGRLTAPFADAGVVQAGGFVLGPDGMRWQWRAAEVDALGADHPFDAGATLMRQGSPQRAVKTQGTNCAFRADVLRAAGGFDPAFRFYLDEADVNLRLAPCGLSAVVPGAVVHHGLMSSRRRRGDRVATDLSDIATSLLHFLRRHAPGADHARLLAAEGARQRARLIRHMVAGRIEPRDVARIMATFQPARLPPPGPLPPRPTMPPPFTALPTGPRPGRVQTTQVGASAAAATHIVTVALPPGRFGRRQQVFHADGYWLISGGQRRPGPSPFPRLRGAAQVQAEIAAVSAYRPAGG
jgi:hypothetical protein